ncbi:hypothetical protein Hypma_002195 [Hypsizygus marmoreus]|uniref:Uncharacterized protein n=1 Tax=Hypsizygus marmoreus TaxID=39966 RepID=A0A369K063_HYPMA|nr:hypothetical protein Hypma_002195 [Hypsizygus marmoreus]
MSTQTYTSLFRANSTLVASTIGHDSIFSPGASPPLILAFLAIGLFAVSMIAIFAWRRIQYARGVGVQEPWAFEGDRWSVDLSDTPKLWDMWTDRTMRQTQRHNADNDASWENITPVAVMAISEKDYVAASDAEAVPRITSFPMQYRRWTPRPRPTALRPTEKADDTQPLPDSNDARRLQVAVAIAMPSQTRRSPPRNRESGAGSDDGDDRLEYCLGLYHCAWTHENG